MTASLKVSPPSPTGAHADVDRIDELAAGPNRCPVCGGHTSLVIYSEAHDPITLDTFSVVKCSGCGLAYTTPRPLAMDRYYPSFYRKYSRVVTRVLGMLYDMRVSRWVRSKPQTGSVLEVGCGPGLMLAAFKRHGWRVSGIERNEEAAETARRVPGVELVTTSIETLPANARFDLIILFQVLEHIGEPVALLRECAERLQPGGNLIINVPNFASWQSRFARNEMATPRRAPPPGPFHPRNVGGDFGTRGTQTFADTVFVPGARSLRLGGERDQPAVWAQQPIDSFLHGP